MQMQAKDASFPNLGGMRGMVPVTHTSSVRSEARDAYAYYVPVDALLRKEDLGLGEEERVVPLPVFAAPPAATASPKRIAPQGAMVEGGAQTDESTLRQVRPPPPSPPPKKAPAVVRFPKPPFFPYGNGNRHPTNSKDFMASYNVNAVMHR